MADELNYLIVGGLSYVGLHIAEYFLKKYPNVKLTILDLSSNTAYTSKVLKRLKNSQQRCTVIIGSCGNNELVKKILEEQKITAVLYNIWNDDVNAVAAQKDHPTCFRKTLSSLTQFLETVRRYGKLTKFLLISSEEVYGKQALKSETTATKPCSLKGAAIDACEMMLRSYLTSYRIPAVVVRLSAVIYGGVMDGNSYSGQDGDAKCGTVGLLHIQDAVVGIGAALEGGQIGEVYNIGGQCDCFPCFLKLIPKLEKGEISSDEIDILPVTMSSMKAELELLWKAKILLPEGIHELIVKSASHCSRMNEAGTHKILVYGTDFALKSLGRLIENKERYLPVSLQRENFVITTRSFNSKDVDIKEIIDVSPSHIVYINIPNMSEAYLFDSEGKNDARAILEVKLYAMLYAPWFLASFCNKRSIHFTYLTSYNSFDANCFTTPSSAIEQSVPHFKTFDYLMAIDIFADRLLQQFDNILFCRAGIKIDEEDNPDLVTCFALNPSLYLSFLSNFIPPILNLALKGHTGMIEVSNPALHDDCDFRKVCDRGNRPFGSSIKILPSKERSTN